MFHEQLQLFRLPSPPAASKTRHLLIGGRIVDYRLKSGTKRLSMHIDERGLRINAPTRTSQNEIDGFVHLHGDWVLKKLAELANASQPRHVAVRDGTRLPMLDGEAEVRVLPGANRVRWIGSQLVLEARADALRAHIGADGDLSCSKHGGIRINWRLIHLPVHLGDYVVAHEVAHLREMNHGKRFWATVESIYPEWKTARVELKERTTSLPIL